MKFIFFVLISALSLVLSSCANHISSDVKSRIHAIYIEPTAIVRCSFPGGEENIPKEIRPKLLKNGGSFNDFLNNAAKTLEDDLLREKFNFQNELRQTTKAVLESKGYKVVDNLGMADARLKITSIIALRSISNYRIAAGGGVMSSTDWHVVDADGVKESVVGAKLATVIELYNKEGGGRILFDQYLDPFEKSPEKIELMAKWFKDTGLLIGAIKSQMAHQTPIALEKLSK